jgi:hypothetical protein
LFGPRNVRRDRDRDSADRFVTLEMEYFSWNHAELGRFDAVVLGLLQIAQFKGQLVIPSFGFYGRDAHVNLIEEGRPIAGDNTLGELSPLMRQNMLLVPEKVANGAIADDAEELAKYQGLLKGTNAFNDFVEKAIA